MNEPIDVDLLFRHLEDPRAGAEVRRMLFHIEDHRAVPALLAHARNVNESTHARFMAVVALRVLRAVEAIPTLREIVADPETDFVLLGFTIAALGILGDQSSFPTLLGLLDHTDAHVRRLAAFGLGELRDRRAVSTLMVRLQEDEEGFVKREAAGALGKIGDPQAVGSLIAALDSSFVSVRAAAARALGAIPDARSVAPLLARLGDPAEEEYVAYAAVVARGQSGDKRAIPTLEWVRDHRVAEYSPDPDVFRLAAAEAIAEIRKH
jgi:HEAT repeat protein